MEAEVVKKGYVDSFRAPLIVEYGTPQPAKDYGLVTEESVRAELADRHFIYMPSRRSLLRTPELSAKREILMKLVYTGQISIDMLTADRNDETSETCMVFYNLKPTSYLK